MKRASYGIALALIVVTAALLQASYLESDYGGAQQDRILPPPRPQPVPDNALTQMIGRVTVRDGYHWGGLTVYPLELSRVGDGTNYLSTAEALAEGLLVVKEKGDGSVPTLVVENKGDKSILMIGGELLLGGKQNRVLREDVLLPARSGPVPVPVLCIEQGRWRRRTEVFESRHSVAPLAVRGAAQAGRSQDEVWAGVKAYQEGLKIESRTGNLQAVHDDPELKKKLGQYREQFGEHCWRRQQVGMVVARGGRIVGADLFANAALFARHRDRLLESYVLDCISHGAARERVALPGRGEAADFLRLALRATYGWRGSPGLGRLLTVGGAGLSGSALVYQQSVLHAYLVRQEVVIIRPPHPPHPIPLPGPMRED